MADTGGGEKKEEQGGVGWKRKEELVVLDGSVMEGGGQILRNSVSLSCLLGRSVVIENIRGKRKKPGLGHQHLCGLVLVRFVFVWWWWIRSWILYSFFFLLSSFFFFLLSSFFFFLLSSFFSSFFFFLSSFFFLLYCHFLSNFSLPLPSLFLFTILRELCDGYLASSEEEMQTLKNSSALKEKEEEEEEEEEVEEKRGKGGKKGRRAKGGKKRKTINPKLGQVVVGSDFLMFTPSKIKPNYYVADTRTAGR